MGSRDNGAFTGVDMRTTGVGVAAGGTGGGLWEEGGSFVKREEKKLCMGWAIVSVRTALNI